MKRFFLTTALTLTLTLPAQAQVMVEHLFHHTYLLYHTELRCVPTLCIPVWGKPQLIYDETLAERLARHCEPTGECWDVVIDDEEVE